MNIYTMMKDRAGLGAGGEDAVGSPAVEGCFGGCAWSMRGNGTMAWFGAWEREWLYLLYIYKGILLSCDGEVKWRRK